MAARHSRMVRILRVAVPAAVALSMASIVLISIFNPFRALMPQLPSMDNLVVSGSKITMESPKIAGIGRNQRAYQVTAETAVQDITKPDQLELKNLRAEGLGILLVEQNLGVALELGDRHYVLSKGEVCFTGDSAALSGNERVLSDHLSV